MVKVLASNLKGFNKNEPFSQRTEECHNLRYESLIIADPKYIEISTLAVLNIK